MKKVIIAAALFTALLMANMAVYAAENKSINITKAYITDDGLVIAEAKCSNMQSGDRAVVMAAGYSEDSLYDLGDIVYFNTFNPYGSEDGSFVLSFKPADWMGENNRLYVVMIGIDTMEKADYFVIDMDNGTAEAIYTGDVNKDGKVDKQDAELIMKYVLNSDKAVLDYDAVKRADVYGDNRIDATDAAMLMKIIGE